MGGEVLGHAVLRGEHHHRADHQPDAPARGQNGVERVFHGAAASVAHRGAQSLHAGVAGARSIPALRMAAMRPLDPPAASGYRAGDHNGGARNDDGLRLEAT